MAGVITLEFSEYKKNKNSHKMLTKFINSIKSIKIVKFKNLDFTGFYKHYKIYKNYKKCIFHPAKVLCGVTCTEGSNPSFSDFYLLLNICSFT